MAGGARAGYEGRITQTPILKWEENHRAQGYINTKTNLIGL